MEPLFFSRYVRLQCRSVSEAAAFDNSHKAAYCLSFKPRFVHSGAVAQSIHEEGEARKMYTGESFRAGRMLRQAAIQIVFVMDSCDPVDGFMSGKKWLAERSRMRS
jgi:hypothetical protein